jgi:hypothetical protein
MQGIGWHEPLQYVPAPHWMPHPPQFWGSFAGFTHDAPQHVRPVPQDASHPAAPLELPTPLELPEDDPFPLDPAPEAPLPELVELVPPDEEPLPSAPDPSVAASL